MSYPKGTNNPTIRRHGEVDLEIAPNKVTEVAMCPLLENAIDCIELQIPVEPSCGGGLLPSTATSQNSTLLSRFVSQQNAAAMSVSSSGSSVHSTTHHQHDHHLAAVARHYCPRPDRSDKTLAISVSSSEPSVPLAHLPIKDKVPSWETERDHKRRLARVKNAHRKRARHSEKSRRLYDPVARMLEEFAEKQKAQTILCSAPLDPSFEPRPLPLGLPKHQGPSTSAKSIVMPSPADTLSDAGVSEKNNEVEPCCSHPTSSVGDHEAALVLFVCQLLKEDKPSHTQVAFLLLQAQQKSRSKYQQKLFQKVSEALVARIMCQQDM